MPPPCFPLSLLGHSANATEGGVVVRVEGDQHAHIRQIVAQ